MKKLFIISLILWWLFLTGCSQQEKLSQNELFEKKQECKKYEKNINTNIVNDYPFQVGEYTNIWVDIFYSPSLVSCLYSVSFNRDYEEIIPMQIYVHDYFTDKLLLKYIAHNDEYSDFEFFDQKVKKLKWE